MLEFKPEERKYDLTKWDEFRPLVQEIINAKGIDSLPLGDGKTYNRKNQVLFRGQSNAQWDVEPTLDRYSDKKYSVIDYLYAAIHYSTEIESFTGKNWGLKDFEVYREETRASTDDHWVNLPCYDYLVYLRHHGFPSPLLDWTESPYIAAYFAFFEKTEHDRVAIYTFIERPHGTKTGYVGSEMIETRGKYVKTHTRHFAQKACYSICTKLNGSNHEFASHQAVFNRNSDRQDLLYKITIPTSERKNALRELNEYNINHFTLFQSEDSLIKAMAIKHFDLE